MNGGGVLTTVSQIVNRPFEPLVLERGDPPASLTDEVVVVIAARDHRLIHPDPVSEVCLLYESEALQGFESPVHTCHTDGSALAAQGVVYLLG